MSRWVPVERFDGSVGRVDVATGEVVATVAEAIGLWSLDDGLVGLLAAQEVAASRPDRTDGAERGPAGPA